MFKVNKIIRKSQPATRVRIFCFSFSTKYLQDSTSPAMSWEHGHQEPEPQSPGLRSIVPSNNYVNYPGQYNGARPRTTNPLYGKPPAPETIQPDYETRISYEAETLRADTKLSLPSYYNQDRTDQPGQRPYQPVPQSDSYSESQAPPQPQQPSEAAMKRIPSGHQARDRASLRQRQRKEMEARAKHGVNTSQYNGHSDNFQHINGKPNGYADMSGGKKTPDMEDKWYLKDSMRPVGAANHGQACKCYRCQRKLTAI